MRRDFKITSLNDDPGKLAMVLKLQELKVRLNARALVAIR